MVIFMARRLVNYVEITDDFDRAIPAEDTVELGIDGTVYELDLTAVRAKELRDFLDQYREVAHDSWKMPPRPGRKKKSPAESLPTLAGATRQKMRDRDARRVIRAWALENGHEAATTGIIRSDVIAAYREANPTAYIPASSLEVANVV